MQKPQIAPIELIIRQITFAGNHSLNQNVPQALDDLIASGGAARAGPDQMPLTVASVLWTRSSRSLLARQKAVFMPSHLCDAVVSNRSEAVGNVKKATLG